MKNSLFFILLALFFLGCQRVERVYLTDLDLSVMEIGWGSVAVDSSVDRNPLKVAGIQYSNGIGTHAISKFMIDLGGDAIRFHALAGVDDESGEHASMEFIVLGDKEVLWRSGIMHFGDSAKEITVDLKGVEKLALYVTDGGDNINYDHADWLDVWIEYRGDRPIAASIPVKEPYILTPPVPENPRINGPEVYGARPGNPFLYRIPVTGKRPVTFSAEGMPASLQLDKEKGIIKGVTPPEGTYEIRLGAKNELGEDTRMFKLMAGKDISLTPPMGWNSWNCWGLSVSAEKIRQAAEAMVSSGLADHGWTYINIDDGWEAAERTESGELLSNEKFPDMEELAGHVHDLGLKIGLYSSPGPLTCGGYLGSWEHEAQDARTWARWGFDYIKYDWCSYSRIAEDRSLPELQKPYIKMKEILDEIDRDIVYSICQYGWGAVWTWGAEVGGNLWRTTGDITDTWSSMAGIGFSQGQCSPYAMPGHWNDPDMLVVGEVGWGPELHKSGLSPDEQYTHISLWSLLSAPMLLGCDLTRLDDFTLNLLTNDEVLAVNQDPSGVQAKRVTREAHYQVWMKEMSDGSMTVGIFNTASDSPEEAFTWDEEPLASVIEISWLDLGLEGPFEVRDLWRQQDLGTFDHVFATEIPYHGVSLIKLEKAE